MEKNSWANICNKLIEQEKDRKVQVCSSSNREWKYKTPFKILETLLVSRKVLSNTTERNGG